MAGKTNIQKNSATGGNATHTDLHRMVKGCIAQDRASQKELYDTYAPQAYGMICRYVQDRNTANEILNEVFYKVLTRLEQYTFQGAFEGWIRRIAVNVITDHYRKNAKHTGMAEVDDSMHEVYVKSDATSRMSYKELLEVVHELPDTQRMVFNLFVFEDCTHKEISEQLNITEGNSRWHLNDARNRLKEKLKKIMT